MKNYTIVTVVAAFMSSCTLNVKDDSAEVNNTISAASVSHLNVDGSLMNATPLVFGNVLSVTGEKSADSISVKANVSALDKQSGMDFSAVSFSVDKSSNLKINCPWDLSQRISVSNLRITVPSTLPLTISGNAAASISGDIDTLLTVHLDGHMIFVGSCRYCDLSTSGGSSIQAFVKYGGKISGDGPIDAAIPDQDTLNRVPWLLSISGGSGDVTIYIPPTMTGILDLSSQSGGSIVQNDTARGSSYYGATINGVGPDTIRCRTESGNIIVKYGYAFFLGFVF